MDDYCKSISDKIYYPLMPLELDMPFEGLIVLNVDNGGADLRSKLINGRVLFLDLDFGIVKLTLNHFKFGFGYFL